MTKNTRTIITPKKGERYIRMAKPQPLSLAASIKEQSEEEDSHAEN